MYVVVEVQKQQRIHSHTKINTHKRKLSNTMVSSSLTVHNKQIHLISPLIYIIIVIIFLCSIFRDQDSCRQHNWGSQRVGRIPFGVQEVKCQRQAACYNSHTKYFTSPDRSSICTQTPFLLQLDQFGGSTTSSVFCRHVPFMAARMWNCSDGFGGLPQTIFQVIRNRNSLLTLIFFSPLINKSALIWEYKSSSSALRQLLSNAV